MMQLQSFASFACQQMVFLLYSIFGLLTQSKPNNWIPDALHSNSAADAPMIGGNASLGFGVWLQQLQHHSLSCRVLQLCSQLHCRLLLAGLCLQKCQLHSASPSRPASYHILSVLT